MAQPDQARTLRWRRSWLRYGRSSPKTGSIPTRCGLRVWLWCPARTKTSPRSPPKPQSCSKSAPRRTWRQQRMLMRDLDRADEPTGLAETAADPVPEAEAELGESDSLREELDSDPMIAEPKDR